MEIDADAVRALIRARVAQFETQKQAAWKMGISEEHLCHILRGDKPPGILLLRQVGVRRVMRYEVVCNPGADSGKMGR